MAETLQQRILRNANGQLVQQNAPTPIAQLAGQNGLPAPPTNPAEAAAIGANAQQQKMIGTPNQLQSALRQSMDTTNTIQEAERDKRYRSQMTTEEQSVANRTKQLGEKLGDTQARTQSLVAAEVNKLANTQPAQQLTTPTTLTVAAGNTQQAVDSAFQAAISKLTSGTPITDPAVQADINSLVTATGLSPEEITARITESATQQAAGGVGEAAAGVLANTIGVAQLLPDMGTTREELAGLLGVAPGAIDTMSLEQLSGALDQISNQAAQTQASAGDTRLGVAERAAFREQARDLSTAGVAETEAQLGALGDAIDRADQVQFGGRTWSVEELLSDDNVSRVISDYLTNPDSPESQALRNDPQAADLLKFVDQYGAPLKAAADQLTTAGTENVAIQEANRKLNTVGDQPISDALMTAVYGDEWSNDPNRRYTQRLDRRGLLAGLDGLAPEEQKPALDAINSLVSKYPSVATEVANLTTEDLQYLFKPDRNGNSPWSQYTTILGDKDTLASTNDVDVLTKYFYGADTATLNSRIEQNEQAIQMGLRPPESRDAYADVYQDWKNDGKVNDKKGLKKNIRAGLENYDTIAEVLAGNKPFTHGSVPPATKTSWTNTFDFMNKYGFDTAKDVGKLANNLLSALPKGDWKTNFEPGAAVDPENVPEMTYQYGKPSKLDPNMLESVLSLPVVKDNKSLYDQVRTALAVTLVANGQNKGTDVPKWAQKVADAYSHRPTPTLSQKEMDKIYNDLSPEYKNLLQGKIGAGQTEFSSNSGGGGGLASRISKDLSNATGVETPKEVEQLNRVSDTVENKTTGVHNAVSNKVVEKGQEAINTGGEVAGEGKKQAKKAGKSAQKEKKKYK